jgi:hypothetical protein
MNIEQVRFITDVAWKELRQTGECIIDKNQIEEINTLADYYEQQIDINKENNDYIVTFKH